jgi:hypothetical protein
VTVHGERTLRRVRLTIGGRVLVSEGLSHA